MSVFSGAGIELCWWSTRGMSLTRRVLCTERTAASMPALRTGWGTLSRQKWWSCRRTRVPTPPRCSAASTQWCSHSATFPAWRAGISPRSPPCSRTEAPRRWTRTRRLKNRGCTGRKLNYQGPSFFFLFLFFLSLSPSSSALCVLERLRLRSGGSDERGRSIRRRALLQINEQDEAFRALHLISIQAVEMFLFNSVPICNSWSIHQLIMSWCNFPFRYKDRSSCHSDRMVYMFWFSWFKFCTEAFRCLHVSWLQEAFYRGPEGQVWIPIFKVWSKLFSLQCLWL